MSMNFAREQSLLRQKLLAKASPDIAAVLQQQHGGTVTFLGADRASVQQAAADLAAAWPAMGRAQMTAFVRTLWSSKIHELRAVGAHLLAARAALLEYADLPLLEGFLLDDAIDAVHELLARDVIGTLASKNKKVWKDLQRFAASTSDRLHRAAVRAAMLPLQLDPDSFPRFVALVTPLLAATDAALQTAIDHALVAGAATHGEAVRAFVQQYGRQVELPKPTPKPAPKPTPKAAPAAAAATRQKRAPRLAPKVVVAKKLAKPAAAAKSPPKKVAAKVIKKPSAKSKVR